MDHPAAMQWALMARLGIATTQRQPRAPQGCSDATPGITPNSSFPKTASDYSLQRTPRSSPHRLGLLLAAGGYLATCPLAIFPPFCDRCGPGRRQGCHGSHPSAASAAGPPGTSSGGLCPGWALQPPPSACHPCMAGLLPSQLSRHRGWEGQMTNIQRGGIPAAPWMYMVC